MVPNSAVQCRFGSLPPGLHAPHAKVAEPATAPGGPDWSKLFGRQSKLSTPASMLASLTWCAVLLQRSEQRVFSFRSDTGNFSLTTRHSAPCLHTAKPPSAPMIGMLLGLPSNKVWSSALQSILKLRRAKSQAKLCLVAVPRSPPGRARSHGSLSTGVKHTWFGCPNRTSPRAPQVTFDPSP